MDTEPCLVSWPKLLLCAIFLYFFLFNKVYGKVTSVLKHEELLSVLSEFLRFTVLKEGCFLEKDRFKIRKSYFY